MSDLTLRHGQKILVKEGETFVVGTCRQTGKPVEVGPVSRAGLIDWLSGTPIQQTALKTLSVGDREFLISSYSSEGWDAMFGNSEED